MYSDIDLTRIKYYPDRFYICLDGFDTDNLTTFVSDLSIGQEQAIFIHEYYHYLTNISTFPGIRQFHLNFCDRFRLITILNAKAGLNAYPINQNRLESCRHELEYWRSVSELISEDDIDYRLVQETESSPNKQFDIVAVQRVEKPMDVLVDSNTVSGGRYFVRIEVSGLLNIQSFDLTFGAIDEFLSSSIDEFLFENDLANVDHRHISQRPFYPYRLFDKLLAFYGINRPTSYEKILIAYYSLNSHNPAVTLIELLGKLHNNGYPEFQRSPENFLMRDLPQAPNYGHLLDHIYSFAQETENQNRIHISQALKYFYDKFYTAQKLKEKDFFYFIRPFLQREVNSQKGKQLFLLALSRIINQFTPPVILKDGLFKYVDKLTTFGEATTLIIATYEIFESLKTEGIAKRPTYLKEKYIFPDQNIDCDKFETFRPPPITSVFQMALNELNLFGIYLRELDRMKSAK